MDPTTLILTALTTGAAASLKDTASTAIKDTYVGLKALIQRKCEGKPKAQAALVEFEEDPETYEKPLRKALTELRVEAEHDVLAAAQHLMTLIQPQQAAMGKYNVQITGNVQGYAQGDHQQVTMNFGHEPQEK